MEILIKTQLEAYEASSFDLSNGYITFTNTLNNCFIELPISRVLDMKFSNCKGRKLQCKYYNDHFLNGNYFTHLNMRIKSIKTKKVIDHKWHILKLEDRYISICLGKGLFCHHEFNEHHFRYTVGLISLTIS